jgi:hypothetical protein
VTTGVAKFDQLSLGGLQSGEARFKSFAALVDDSELLLGKIGDLVEKQIVEDESFAAVAAEVIEDFETGNLAGPRPEIRARFKFGRFFPEHRVDFLKDVVDVACGDKQAANQAPKASLVASDQCDEFGRLHSRHTLLMSRVVRISTAMSEVFSSGSEELVVRQH